MMKEQFYKDVLTQLEGEHRLRTIEPGSHQGVRLDINGKQYINLSSNDYLGISSNTSLQKRFLEQQLGNDSFIMGSGSSRLLTGNSQATNELELLLANLYGTESALIFNSGYHANIGILPAVAVKGDVILADRHIHASIIDGIRLSEARFERYRHNDYNHLEDLLKKHRPSAQNIFIVTESLFSMDGDLADINTLIDLKNRYNAFLYIDEAHAFGAFGKDGLGVCANLNKAHCIDFLVGTFGKAAASYGAFVATSHLFKKYLINTMRPLIFSTALPPIIANWNLFITKELKQFCDERATLSIYSSLIRESLKKKGIMLKGESYIVPVVTQENDAAIELSRHYKNNGIWALPIRYPTVPKGEACVRLSLRADLQTSDIEQLITSTLNGNHQFNQQ